MNLKLANNAVAQIAAPITAAQTSFSLLTGQGAKFPALSNGDYFTLTATRSDGVREVMWVTARAFDVLTVLRGQENTLALDFETLTIVENRLTAESLLTEIHAMNSLVNAALSTFQPGVPVGADQLRLLLVGVLGVDQLTSDLASRISQIDATSAVAGSVNQRVKAATDAFIAGLLQEANNRTTAIANYGYSKQDTIAAISAQVQITSAQLTAYADAARQQAVSQASADVRSYTYSQAAVNNAISASEQTLRAEFSGGTGGGPSYATQAYVQSYAYSMAQADGAIASKTADLRSTVGNNTAAIQSSQTTLNGLSAQVYTKIDNNGYVTGYGLSSSASNGTPTSAFVIRADQFMVAAPNGTPQPMFSVQNVAGKSVAVFSGQLIIGPGGLALNRDPYFTDIPGNWTGPSNLVIGTGAGGNGPASTFIGVGPSAQGIVFCKERINIDVSKTYLLAASLYQDSGFAQNCIILIDFYDNNGNHLSTNWGDQTYSGYVLNVQPPSAIWTTYRSGVFGPGAKNGHAIPAGAKTCRIGASLNANGSISSGLMALTGLRLEEQLGGTSIQDGAITAQKIFVDYLSSITAFLGTVDVGVNGYMRSGQPSFNVGSGFWLGNDNGVSKLSIGSPNGNRLTYDGVNLQVVIAPGAAVNISPVSPTFNFSSNVQYTNAFIGTYSAAPINTPGTRFSYAWSISSTNTALVVSISGNPNASSVTCSATFRIISQGYDVYLTCVMTDLDTGTSFKGSVDIYVNVGGA